MGNSVTSFIIFPCFWAHSMGIVPVVSPFSLPSCPLHRGHWSHRFRGATGAGSWYSSWGWVSLSRLVIGPMDDDIMMDMHWLIGIWIVDSDHSYLSRQIIAMVLCGFVWAADGAELLLLGCLAEPGSPPWRATGGTSLSWPCYLDRSIWYRSVCLDLYLYNYINII